jgi:hypothetical protein
VRFKNCHSELRVKIAAAGDPQQMSANLESLSHRTLEPGTLLVLRSLKEAKEETFDQVIVCLICCETSRVSFKTFIACSTLNDPAPQLGVINDCATN